MMNNTLVGVDTVDLMVDVNGCRACVAVFRLLRFCVSRLFLGFGLGYWS